MPIKWQEYRNKVSRVTYFNTGTVTAGCQIENGVASVVSFEKARKLSMCIGVCRVGKTLSLDVLCAV
jgi:hypothetical protein